MTAVLFMLCFTLHNMEEALWMVRWKNKRTASAKKPENNDHFLFTLLGITSLGYLAAGLHLLFPANWMLERCFIGFVGAMLVNAVVPHLVLTVVSRRFCPGVVTGSVLMLPLNSVILYQAVAAGLKLSHLVLSTLIVGALLLTTIVVLRRVAAVALKTICT